MRKRLFFPPGSGFRKLAAVLLVSLFVAGCKVDLNTGLSEQESNEILAILMENGIKASKLVTGENSVTVQVNENDMLPAINLLRHYGFPRKQRDTLGNVFQKAGIMSSPFEERIRFIYALSEELSKTLTEIDGVISARVHIVLPENSEFRKETKPSSVAVFIKHREGLDLDFYEPQIKRLVSNAVEGVTYDNVSVVLVEAEAIASPEARLQQLNTDSVLGISVAATDKNTLIIYLSAGLFLLLALVAGNVSLFLFYLKGKRKSDTPANADQFEPV